MTHPSPPSAAATADAWRLLAWIAGALCALGLLARLSPLSDLEGRLFWQYMTEDGYLMQTVARNMAIGLGMSTGAGTMPTNGVQPLATFLYAGMHALFEGARTPSMALVTIWSALVSAAAAACFYVAVRRALADDRAAQWIAVPVAVLWFIAPHIVRHGMNGLETGLYHLAVLAAVVYYLGIVAGGQPLVWRQRLALGFLLGVAFLARNDAVFFIAALLLTHLWLGGRTEGGGRGHRLADTVVAGLTSIAVAAPWLAYNQIRFGSIVPISGTAQSHQSVLGQNLPLIPANLFENMVLFLPIPSAWEARLPVVIVCLLVVLGVLVAFWWLMARSSLPLRRFFCIGMLFSVGLVGYYGLYFGAAWFLPRYLSVLSPFLWFAAFAVGVRIAFGLFAARPARALVLAGTLALAGLGTAFLVQQYVQGTSHMHRQVVEWTQRNVAAQDWVGAPQTGTLGYFHDRTINLDGKVNPQALQVLRSEGHVLNYVLASDIRYIVDWVGMADWVKMDHAPRFRTEFEVLVRDEQLNLGVLRRIGPAPQPAAPARGGAPAPG